MPIQVTAASLPASLPPTVNYLTDLQFPSGNFPSSLESCHGSSHHSDRLVHWCHGAPGFTHLLSHAYQVKRLASSMVCSIFKLPPSGVRGCQISVSRGAVWGCGLGARVAEEGLWAVPRCCWQCLLLPPALSSHWPHPPLVQGSAGEHLVGHMTAFLLPPPSVCRVVCNSRTASHTQT